MALVEAARRGLLKDARRGQIVCLASLLCAGVFLLDFRIPPWLPLCVFATALAVQALASRIVGLRFDPLSALITAFSLSFLLRVDTPALAVLAAAIAIGSKFLLRFNGRHVFNPANLGLVVVTLAFSHAWISPGQWGALGLAAVLLTAAGATVAGGAKRLDSALAFLGAWAALLYGRALWFGDPMAIPTHQLQSGAVLIFAFFMISDPATTPRKRWLRLVHGVAVAGLGFWLQMEWISETGPIHALILLAPVIALADWAVERPRRAAETPMTHTPSPLTTKTTTIRETAPCSSTPSVPDRTTA